MPTIRLYISDTLSEEAYIHLPEEQSHYLRHVMRMREGETINLFNGRDGEWIAEIAILNKKTTSIRVISLHRPQASGPDIWLAFAPIKNAALHVIAQKATELGCSALLPIITEHTVIHQINTQKLLANAIEAAEQCERLTVPDVYPPQILHTFLETFPKDRILVCCDESGEGQPIFTALANIQATRFALLIGPEGGFSTKELDILHRHPHVVPVGLGPRILRADTAALAGLACLQAACGDWHAAPRFTP